MSFRPHAMRSISDYDQGAQETRARNAIRATGSPNFRPPSFREVRRQRIALAKTFKDKPRVLVDGNKEGKVSGVDERSGNVFVNVGRRRRVPYSPYNIQRLN